MTVIDQVRFARHRDATAAMAQRRGWKVPDDYTRLTAIAAAAVQVRDEQPDPEATPPTKPADVPRWIDTEAKRRAIAAERARVAAELAEHAGRDAIRTVLAEIPGNYIPALVIAFDEAVTAFRKVSATAPHEVTSTTSPGDAEQHVKLLGCVDTLTIAAADRVQLASTTGELASLDHGNAAWLWFDPREDATIHGVTDFLAAFRAPPVDLDGWQRAVQIGVSLAPYDEAEHRLEHFNAARHAAGMGPDGGMADRSIAEAYRMVGQRPSPALARSQ
jgi:hypothetical protein